MTTLRTLAKDYANGVLNKDVYRKSRDELLAGVISGKTQLPVNEYRAPLPEQGHDLDSTFEKTEIRPVSTQKMEETVTELVTPPSPPRREHFAPPPEVAVQSGSPVKHNLLIGGVVIAVAVLVMSMPVMEKVDGPDSVVVNPESPAIADSLEIPATTQKNTSASDLINDFLNQRNWSDENLQRFIEVWNSLALEEQASGLASPISIQLTNAIYKQLLEERALFGTGNYDAIMARQYALVSFAEAIGINDPRLKVREIDPELLAPSTNSSMTDQ